MPLTSASGHPHLWKMSLKLDVGKRDMVVVVSFRLALFHLDIYFVILDNLHIFFPLLVYGPCPWHACTIALNSRSM